MSRCLIFDAGPLINFAMNGLLPLLIKTKAIAPGQFLITKEVRTEIIDTPLTIKKYELEALQLKELYDKKIIKLADITEAQVNQLREIRERLMNAANSTFFIKGKPLHIMDKGEAACLALAKITGTCFIVVDERTTRMLCENPENLRKLFQKKFHNQVTVNKKNLELFKEFKIIRSTELAYIAYKKGLFEIKDPKALEATLYGLKFRGCSISEEEIEQMKRM